jgi:hypothetical protein
VEALRLKRAKLFAERAFAAHWLKVDHYDRFA